MFLPVFASSVFLKLKSKTSPFVGDELLSNSGDVNEEFGEEIIVWLGVVDRLGLTLIGDLGEEDDELSKELLLVSLILNM